MPSPPPLPLSFIAKDNKLEPQVSVASPEPAWGASRLGLEEASYTSAALTWASVYMTQAGDTNKPSLHGAASGGCFSQPLNAREQPALQFRKNRGRDYYLYWIQLSSLSASRRSKGRYI